MPGPQRPSLHRRPKPDRIYTGLGHAQFSSAYRDASSKQLPRTTKVRVLCTDPYATESSSDDDEEQLEKSPPKKLVAEVLVPIHCLLPSSDPSCSSSSDSEADLKELQLCSLGHVSVQGARIRQWAGKRLMKTQCIRKATHSWMKKACEPVPENAMGCSKISRCRPLKTPHLRSGKWATEMEGLVTCGISGGAHDRVSKRIQCLQDAFFNSHHCLDINRSVECGLRGCCSWHTVRARRHGPGNDLKRNGLRNAEMDLLQSCSDMPSPSSVLQNPALEDCSSPVRLASDKAVAFVLTDETSASSLGTSAGESFTGVSDVKGRLVVSLKPDSISNTSAMDATPFIEECNSSFGDWAQIFDVENFGCSEEKQNVQHLLDTMTGLFDDGGDFGDMEFDLDSEALAWINVPETCGR